MAKKSSNSIILMLFVFAIFSCKSLHKNVEQSDNLLISYQKTEKVIVAYVTSWTNVMPESEHITHINYAFGHVNDSFDGVRIDNENKLREILKLKERNRDLKILLSVGGWGSGNFSEMAADEKLRTRFVADCKRVVDEFRLDGIDLDWEFPGSSSAGISSSVADKENFTLLISDLRKVLGYSKLLTLASSGRRIYFDFPAIIDKLDFVNLMTYDMGAPPFHHSAAFTSAFTQRTGDKSVDLHLKAGVPREKLVYGIPFYGRGKDESMEYVTYGEVKKLDFIEKWDAFAKQPFLVNQKGEIMIVYDNPLSIAYKCDYIIEQGLKGAMFWEYAGDDENGSLRKALWMNLMK